MFTPKTCGEDAVLNRPWFFFQLDQSYEVVKLQPFLEFEFNPDPWG